MGSSYIPKNAEDAKKGSCEAGLHAAHSDSALHGYIAQRSAAEESAHTWWLVTAGVPLNAILLVCPLCIPSCPPGLCIAAALIGPYGACSLLPDRLLIHLLPSSPTLLLPGLLALPLLLRLLACLEASQRGSRQGC